MRRIATGCRRSTRAKAERSRKDTAARVILPLDLPHPGHFCRIIGGSAPARPRQTAPDASMIRGNTACPTAFGQSGRSTGRRGLRRCPSASCRRPGFVWGRFTAADGAMLRWGHLPVAQPARRMRDGRRVWRVHRKAVRDRARSGSARDRRVVPRLARPGRVDSAAALADPAARPQFRARRRGSRRLRRGQTARPVCRVCSWRIRWAGRSR